jgi:hypothetical protein
MFCPESAKKITAGLQLLLIFSAPACLFYIANLLYERRLAKEDDAKLSRQKEALTANPALWSTLSWKDKTFYHQLYNTPVGGMRSKLRWKGLVLLNALYGAGLLLMLAPARNDFPQFYEHPGMVFLLLTAVIVIAVILYQLTIRKIIPAASYFFVYSAAVLFAYGYSKACLAVSDAFIWGMGLIIALMLSHLAHYGRLNHTKRKKHA